MEGKKGGRKEKKEVSYLPLHGKYMNVFYYLINVLYYLIRESNFIHILCVSFIPMLTVVCKKQ